MNLNFRQKKFADYYRKRWDIEVFLIPKAELNQVIWYQ